jgi:membrane protease YdiL (CAAX protease family)
MHKEFKFHTWLWMAAFFVAAAFLWVLDAVPALKAYPEIAFGISMALALSCLVMAIRAALKDEEKAPVAGHKRRMIALGGMIVCGIGFLGFAAAYFWPISSTLRDPQHGSADQADSGRVERRSEGFLSVQRDFFRFN